MGTNFYWRVSLFLPTGDEVPVDRDDPRVHIGKRSAAGLYCWDCGVTLDKRGVDGVNKGHPTVNPVRDGFRAYLDAMAGMRYDACPKCGRSKDDGSGPNTAMVELGFEKDATRRPTGVAGCSSFSWAQDPEVVGAVCQRHPNDPIIEDEYGRVFTGDEFRTMLDSGCPIRRTDSIGQCFC